MPGSASRPVRAIDAIFYDLDGTLADSCAGIEWAARQALAQRWPDLKIGPMRHLIGPPIRIILSNVLSQHGVEDLSVHDLDDLQASYRALYDGPGCQMASAFPDVRAGLERRQAMGLRQFVVTNKPRLPTQKMLQALDLARFIEQAVSPDSRVPPFAHKGEAARWLLEQHSLKGEHMIFVGDARDDAMAAHFAGARFVAASWGYGNAAQVEDAPVWGVARQFGDLDEMLERQD